MTTHSWIRNLFARPARTVRTEGSRAAGRARYRPAIEALEDRSLPAVTFAPAVNYGAGSNLYSVAVGDFDGDGKPDLATANSGGLSGNVSVLLGKGDGTFKTAVNYGAGRHPFSVAVGDFNGDGKPDLAVDRKGVV